jgi:hypothetical protein
MTALAANPVEEPEASSPQLVAVTDAAPLEAVPPLVPPEIVAAEAHWWRGLVLGALIGIPVCALLWMGIVGLALVVADPGWPVWPALGMAACVGVFAGMFLGGWAGVTACAEQLDEAELHTPRPRR